MGIIPCVNVIFFNKRNNGIENIQAKLKLSLPKLSHLEDFIKNLFIILDSLLALSITTSQLKKSTNSVEDLHSTLLTNIKVKLCRAANILSLIGF